jgi:hypothetical protein
MMLSKNWRLQRLVFLGGVALYLAANIAKAQEVPEQVPAAKPQTTQPSPELKQRPPITPEEKAAAEEGRLHFDIVVTDKSGTPVAGLNANEFSLQNNGKPQPIVTFHASDGTQGTPDSQVSVFLMIDTVNSGLVDLSFMRNQVEQFLRQNSGHLLQPTTVILFTDAGSEVVGNTSQDGNALADAVHAIKPAVHTIHSAAGHEALFERFQLSVKALGALAAREIDDPRRKMLIWIGPGWPILRAPDTNYDARSHALNFDAIALLSKHLREARMVLCSAGGGSPFKVQDLMKPVKSPIEATPREPCPASARSRERRANIRRRKSEPSSRPAQCLHAAIRRLLHDHA